jgi:hypothetical protein
MASPPLLRSLRLALALGAVGGALLGFSLTGKLQLSWPWRMAATIAGAGLGAVCGLDLLLPGPGKSLSPSRGPRRGPFTSTVILGLATLLALGGGAYSLGRLELTLERNAGGRVDLTRRATVLFGQIEGSRTVVEGVQSAEQAHSSRVVVRSATEPLPSVFDQVPADMAERINAFVGGREPRLVIRSRSLEIFPVILFAASPVCGVLAFFVGRNAIRLLKAQLGGSQAGKAVEARP